jgi:hypothetical protein
LTHKSIVCGAANTEGAIKTLVKQLLDVSNKHALSAIYNNGDMNFMPSTEGTVSDVDKLFGKHFLLTLLETSKDQALHEDLVAKQASFFSNGTKWFHGP